MNDADSKKLEEIKEIVRRALNTNIPQVVLRKETLTDIAESIKGLYTPLEIQLAEQDREIERLRDSQEGMAVARLIMERDYQCRHRKWALKKVRAYRLIQQDIIDGTMNDLGDEVLKERRRAEKAEAELAELKIWYERGMEVANGFLDTPSESHIVDRICIIGWERDELRARIKDLEHMNNHSGDIPARTQRRVQELEEALYDHRADLHCYSSRPCPTCRNSAIILGIADKVPYCCAREETDREARRLLAEKEKV